MVRVRRDEPVRGVWSWDGQGKSFGRAWNVRVSEQVSIFARESFEREWDESRNRDHNVRLSCPRVGIPDGR